MEEPSESIRADEMGGALETAPARIEARPTGPLYSDRGSNLLLPLP
jgi:hypothetical protein